MWINFGPAVLSSLPIDEPVGERSLGDTGGRQKILETSTALQVRLCRSYFAFASGAFAAGAVPACEEMDTTS
jgi:hypothetical protein